MSFLHKLSAIITAALLASTLAIAAGVTQIIPASDLMPTSQLNSQLTEVKSGKVVLIHVGFLVMYRMGHIPGSRYVGPASRPEGMVALEKLVAKLPHNQQIVIYCGCCPWVDCPNIRPAYHALKQLGFTNVKALSIPDRLGSDWTSKGFPIVNGD